MALKEPNQLHLSVRNWAVAAFGSVAKLDGVVSTRRRETYGQVWRINDDMAQVEWERLFPILEKAVGVLFILGIAALGVWMWTVNRKTRLKNNMVERGFTASEIEDVIGTGRRR